MTTIHVPLGESAAILGAIPDATPQQHADAYRYLARRNALDVLPLLGIAHVPAWAESHDDGT